MPIIHFKPAIIHPLYFTAVKCRDGNTCWEAISLLSSRPWREGAWDSAAMAKIAERALINRPRRPYFNRARNVDHQPQLQRHGYSWSHSIPSNFEVQLLNCLERSW